MISCCLHCVHLQMEPTDSPKSTFLMLKGLRSKRVSAAVAAGTAVEKGFSRLRLSLGCICTGLWVSLGRGSLHVVAAGSATRGVRAHRNALGSRDVAVAGGVRHRPLI